MFGFNFIKVLSELLSDFLGHLFTKIPVHQSFEAHATMFIDKLCHIRHIPIESFLPLIFLQVFPSRNTIHIFTVLHHNLLSTANHEIGIAHIQHLFCCHSIIAVTDNNFIGKHDLDVKFQILSDDKGRLYDILIQSNIYLRGIDYYLDSFLDITKLYQKSLVNVWV